MVTKNTLTELCTSPMDILEPAMIPENATPIGRPVTIKQHFAIASLGDFNKVYGDILRNYAPEEANAYVRGGGGKIDGLENDWCVQFYRVEKD